MVRPFVSILAICEIACGAEVPTIAESPAEITQSAELQVDENFAACQAPQTCSCSILIDFSGEQNVLSGAQCGPDRICCSSSTPPPPPPPPPPSIPNNITYGLYRTSASVPVSWGISAGSGLPVQYELQEQRNGSSWTLVYRGSAKTTVLGNRETAVYTYRVRACSEGGCSPYRTGRDLVVSLRPTMDLYTQYPFLREHDQRNAAYRATWSPIRGEFLSTAVASASPLSTQDASLNEAPNWFWLGQGFNLLTDAYADNCIDTTKPDFQIVANPTNTTDFDSDLIDSVSQLYNIMQVDANAGVSFNLEGYSVGLMGERRRFTESVQDETKQLYVARWTRNAERWTLASPSSPLMSDFAAHMLIPNNFAAQNKFRERCGDKYIYAADLGASLYMAFSYDTKTYNSTQRKELKGQIRAALDSILTFGGAGSVKSEARALFNQLDVKVKFYKVGGPEIGAVDRSNFEFRVNQFIGGVSAANYAAVHHDMRHYDHPDEFINYPYFEVFADYRIPLAQLGRWNVIDAERQRRCDLLDFYYNGQFTNTCEHGQQELETAKKLCIETSSWNQCSHPVNYYTLGYNANNPGPLPVNSHLVTWLNDHVDGMNEQERSASGDYHELGSVFDTDCQDINLPTCLDTGCVVDTRRGFSIGAGQGFGYTEYFWDAPGNDSFHRTDVQSVNGQRCVVTTAKICTSHADTTADYELNQVIFGRCATPKPFLL